jgi:hypothetical protein
MWPIIVLGHVCPGFFQVFSSSTDWKGGWGDNEAPNNNRDMTYQSNGKELRKMI